MHRRCYSQGLASCSIPPLWASYRLLIERNREIEPSREEGRENRREGEREEGGREGGRRVEILRAAHCEPSKCSFHPQQRTEGETEGV